MPGCLGSSQKWFRFFGKWRYRPHRYGSTYLYCPRLGSSGRGPRWQVYSETQSQKPNKCDITMGQSLKYEAKYTPGVMETRWGHHLLKEEIWKDTFGWRVSTNKDAERRNGHVFVKNCKWLQFLKCLVDPRECGERFHWKGHQRPEHIQHCIPGW